MGTKVWGKRLGQPVKKLKFVLSVPGDNMYLREQIALAKATAERLGAELQVLSADMDPVAQSQQLLEHVQSKTERPDGIFLEPVNATGLPRVAEAAVAAGIGWVVSNAQVEYLGTLRRTAKTPVFQVSQDHVEVGRIQARQIAAMFPEGGSVLYLRGPAMNSLAARRFEGLEGGKPKNIEIKSVKVQSTANSSYNAVCSWLSLSTVRPEATQLIVSQNADFILGARKAFDALGEPDRSKWLALPCAGASVASLIKPMVDQGTFRAAVLTPLTMDRAVEMLVRAIADGVQPQEKTFVEAQSYPSLEELAKRRR